MEVIYNSPDSRKKRLSKFKKIQKFLLNKEAKESTNNELIEIIEKIFEDYKFSLDRINKEKELKYTSDEETKTKSGKKEKLYQEIPSVSVFLIIIENLLSEQLLKKEKISDHDILNILPVILSKVTISRESYQKIYNGLIDFFSKRKQIKTQISDEASFKKRIIQSRLPSLNPKEVFDLSEKIKVTEGIFGAVIYSDSETIKKIYEEPSPFSIRGFVSYDFKYIKNPKKNQRENSSKYIDNFPIIFISVDSINNPLSIDKSKGTKLHEQFHLIYDFFLNQNKMDRSKEEENVLKNRLSEYWKLFIKDSTDLNDKNSEKFKKLINYFHLIMKKHNKKERTYEFFLNELCAQIEGGNYRIIFQKENSDLKKYLNYLENFPGYLDNLIKKIDGVKLNFHNNESIFQPLWAEFKKDFVKDTLKEFDEIKEIILRITELNPKAVRLILYSIISTNNPLRVKETLLLLEESLKSMR